MAYWEVEVVTLGTEGKFKAGVAAAARSAEDKKRLNGQIGDGLRSWGLSSTQIDINVGFGVFLFIGVFCH